MNHFKKKNKKLEKLRGIFFQLGLIIACGLTLLAFEWTFPTRIADLGGVIVEEIEEDFDYVPPFEKEKEEVIEEKQEETKSKSEDYEIVPDDHKEIEEEKKEKKEEPKPEFKESEWGTVEPIDEPTPPVFMPQKWPHYKDCADAKNEEERKQCTQEKMYKHFSKNIRIPEVIKMKGEGVYKVYVYFEINKKGEIDKVKVLNEGDKKIPKELIRQAYNAVKTLPNLIPGKNYGKKVSVPYSVPIVFTVL